MFGKPKEKKRQSTLKGKEKLADIDFSNPSISSKDAGAIENWKGNKEVHLTDIIKNVKRKRAA